MDPREREDAEILAINYVSRSDCSGGMFLVLWVIPHSTDEHGEDDQMAIMTIAAITPPDNSRPSKKFTLAICLFPDSAYMG